MIVVCPIKKDDLCYLVSATEFTKFIAEVDSGGMDIAYRGGIPYTVVKQSASLHYMVRGKHELEHSFIELPI